MSDCKYCGSMGCEACHWGDVSNRATAAMPEQQQMGERDSVLRAEPALFDLPPLPGPWRLSYERPHGTQELFYFNAGQMRMYGRECIDAASRFRAEGGNTKPESDSVAAPELDVEAERLTTEQIEQELESAREYIVEGFGYKYNEEDLHAAIRRLAARSVAQDSASELDDCPHCDGRGSFAHKGAEVACRVCGGSGAAPSNNSPVGGKGKA